MADLRTRARRTGARVRSRWTTVTATYSSWAVENNATSLSSCDHTWALAMDRPFKYDVCLSFAGEDRIYVETVAQVLREAGVSVFYDRYFETDLWGKNLYEHLSRVYRDEARYCVMFISHHYATKLWTSHERRGAQERAFRESVEYILPVRFDDTEVPGLSTLTGYLDLAGRSPEHLAGLIIEKLHTSAATDCPRSTTTDTAADDRMQAPLRSGHVETTGLSDRVMTELMSDHRLRVIAAFGDVPRQLQRRYVAELYRLLDPVRPTLCVSAMAALFFLRDKALASALVPLAQDGAVSVRRRALYYLGELKFSPALPVVSAAMSDFNGDIRAAARQAFTKMPGRRPE